MNEQANSNPWVVRESRQRVALPENQSYMVTFRGVEPCEITLKTGEKKAKWRWLWEVKTGEHAGRQTDTLTDRDISPDTLPGKLVAGLLGQPLKPNDNVKALVDACVGQVYIGMCQKGPQQGAACIRSVSKPPQM